MSEENKNGDEVSIMENSKGEHLRLAREALGLEASEVAAKLYFETRFILALESDDHSVFAGSAYLYGYMRAYVKFLKLPLDEFVCDLKNIEEENKCHFEHISYEPVLQTKQKRWMLPTVIVLLLMLIVIAGFILMSGDNSAKADSISLLTEAEIQAVQEIRSIPIPLAGEAQADTAEANGEDGMAISKAGGSAEADRETLVSRNTSADIATLIAILPRLRLEYKANSWTDIRDADGKRLVYRVVEKGNRLELDSSLSYSILLGYSPGVSISWNDQPFNLSEYERENIAYFVVGEKKKLSSVASVRK